MLGDTTICAGFLEYGSPEKLGMHILPMPKPGERQVLVEVAYATVNPADIHLRSGGLRDWVSGEPPYCGGMEFTGQIVATGPGSRWRIGDKVAGLVLFFPSGRGAHCRHIAVDDDSIAIVPPSLAMDKAAAIPMSGITARLAIDKVKPYGRKIAITGAVGSVGSIAIRLALTEGLEPIAIVRRSQFDRAKELGAVHVVDAEDFTAQIRAIAPDGVDALIDAAILGKIVEPCIRDGGYYGGLRQYDFSLGRDIEAGLIGMPEYVHEQTKIQELLDIAARGEFSVSIAKLFSPENTAEAERQVDAGGLGGRVMLDFTHINLPQA